MLIRLTTDWMGAACIAHCLRPMAIAILPSVHVPDKI